MTPTATLHGVEVFEAGKYPVTNPDGSVEWVEYTPRDLADMVRNFKLAEGRIDVPLVVGHEETQPLAGQIAPDDDPWPAAFAEAGMPDQPWDQAVTNTGSPAFGYMRNPRVAKAVGPDGNPRHVIRADFHGVHHSIASLVNRGAYTRVSAEVHDNPTHGHPANCKGRTFRRVSLLGGYPPNQKGLAKLPAARFADAAAFRRLTLLRPSAIVKGVGGHGWRVFSEVGVMDRTDQEAHLKALGWTDAQIEATQGMDDDAFAALTTATLAAAAGVNPDTPAEPDGDEPPAAADATGANDTPPRDQMTADLVAMGVPQEQLDALSDEDLATMWKEKKGTAMADANRHRTVPVPRKPSAQPVVSARRFAELEAKARQIDLSINRRLAAEQRAETDAHCKRWNNDGNVTPGEVDADPKRKVPNLRDRLLHADRTRLRKFADGVPAMTEFDALVAEIDARGPGWARRNTRGVIPDADDAEFADVDKDLKRYMNRRGMGKRA